MKVKLYVLQRITLLFILFFLTRIFAFSQQVAKVIPNSDSPEGIEGFLEFRPSDYGSQKHPLIIFLHGIGERGDGTTQINNVATWAIPYFCAHGATMRFTVNGQTSSFVTLSPQLSTQLGYWPPSYVKNLIAYAKANLQIDTNRIYLTGLSLGGGGVWRAITDASNWDYSFDSKLAAAAPVCGTQEENDATFCGTIGANHLPIWAFHSMDDGTVGVGATQHAQILGNICGVTPAPKFTYYQTGNHFGAWINAFDTGHITTVVDGGANFTANPNLYEWMLSNTRATATSSNTPPLANAGAAQTITLPVNTVTLNGTATGTNGASIASSVWTKASGPAAGTIGTSSSLSTTVTGLVSGTYVFTLTVTDNHGLTNSSNVTITVNATYTPPIANAGSPITITLPQNIVTLTGTASGTNGASIASTVWSQLSGPSTTNIGSPGALTTWVINLVPGTYVFTLTVTDNHGLTNSSNITVTVNAAPNQPPVANAGSNINITLPTNSTALNGSGSNDPDGTIATVLWSKTSGPSSYTISNTGILSPSLSNLVQGIYVFNLTVTDNSGAGASSSVSVTVNAAPNQPPVANAGSNINITLPTNSAVLNGSGSNDPDGTITTVLWSKTSGPSSYTISNTGILSPSLSNLVQGVYVFKLTVTDNSGASASSSVSVTVNAAPNQPPVANAGSNINITLPTNSSVLNGSGSNDPDGTITTVLWSKTSGPSSYTINNTGILSPSLSNLVQGVYVFNLTVTDNSGASASSSVSVTVNAAPNQPPVANAGSNINITLPTNSAVLNGSGSNDPDGTITTVLWSKTSGPSSYTINNTGILNPSLSNLVQGVYVFNLTVTDNSGASASSVVTVVVNAASLPVNQAPVANAGGNINITLPVNNVVLDGSASYDPDGTIVSYAWTKISGPSSFNIISAGTASTAVNNLAQGSYVFALQVTDNAGATASSTVTVNVNVAPNQAPVADAGSNINITLPVNSATLNGSASNDPDGTIVSYAWSKISGPASFSIANAGGATTTISNLVQGVYVFNLTVTDNSGASASSSVTVTLNAAANQPPVANGGSNISITLPTSSTTLNGSASNDPDGTIASYAWSKTSGPASFSIANADAAATTISNLVQGVYVFNLTVTDNAGSTATSSVTVTVNPAANQLPVANAGVDITITLPVNTTALDGSRSTDPDGTITAYNWNRISGPTAVTIVNSNTATPSVIGLVQGQYTFELTVTDNSGATSTDQVVVTVSPQPNKAPVANAGKDTSIALPANVVTVSGSNSMDPDGTITGYRWKQISGPSSALIAQSAAAITSINNLVEGDYVFELQVTDNAGATATAKIKVSVVNNFRYSDFFKLYPNPATSNLSLQFIDDNKGKFKITVYDINARLVVDQDISKDQSLLTKQIDVSTLKPGMYYLEIGQVNGKRFVRPFIKQ